MLTCKRAKFSLPRNSTYLNCAYMSPLLKSAEKAGLRGLRLKRNPADIHPEDFFSIVSGLRNEFARLIGEDNGSRIAIVPSASYGLATASKNAMIKQGEHVIVVAEQFPSNYYPWQALVAETGAGLKVVAPEKAFKDRGKIWNEKLLDSINAKTRVVALPHVHWTDGTLFDLEAVRQRTSEVGALLIVDGTQSVGALPFNVQKIKPDALICAAYKWLLGPYGIGLAYYGERFDNGRPVEENWINRLGSDNFSSLVTYEPRYQPGAQRYSVGEQSNFILAPMALKSIAQINRWHVENIQDYCEAITGPVIDRLRERGFLIEELPYRASHLFGIRHSTPLDSQLLREKLQKRKIQLSIRGDAIRVSPHVYNDAEDLNRLASVLLSSI